MLRKLFFSLSFVLFLASFSHGATNTSERFYGTWFTGTHGSFTNLSTVNLTVGALDIGDALDLKADKSVFDDYSSSTNNRLDGIDTSISNLEAGSFSPEEYGATGGTDDTVAWTSLISAVNSAGTGKVVLKPGRTYTLSYDYANYAAAVGFKNVNGLVIEGNGATIKVKNATPVAASRWGGYGFLFVNCTRVSLSDVSINGNADNLSYTGNPEAIANGITIYGVKDFKGENIEIKKAGSDGIYIGDGVSAGLGSGYDSNRISFKNLYIKDARRHGLTVASVYDLTVDTGEITGGGYNTGVVAVLDFGSGMDIEPNATPGVNRASFKNVTFGSSYRASVIAASNQVYVHNVVFENCNFSNTLNTTLILNSSEFSLLGGRVYGEFQGGGRLIRNVSFIQDTNQYAGSAQTILMGLDSALTVEDCTFYSDRAQRFVDVGGSTTLGTKKVFRNNSFTYSGNGFPDTAALFKFLGVGILENSYFYHTGTPPMTRYSIQLPADQTTDLSFTVFNSASDTPIKFYYGGSGNSAAGGYRDGLLKINKLKLYPNLDTSVGTQVEVFVYSGTPESYVAAPVGSLSIDYTNGVIYIKKTGTGNTGWKLITQAS